jgi:hypothetical protein
MPVPFDQTNKFGAAGMSSKLINFQKRRECGFLSTEYKGTFLENTKLEPFQIV